MKQQIAEVNVFTCTAVKQSLFLPIVTHRGANKESKTEWTKNIHTI